MQRELETLDLYDALGASRQAFVTAAHDLKAPLGLIKLYAQHMQTANLSPEDYEKYLRRIALSAEQLLKMTSGLLETYRYGDTPLPLEPVNIGAVCEEVLHELTPYARELGQKLQYSMAQRKHVVVAHRILLRNVLFNIAHNALKHTPENTAVTLKLSRGQTMSRIHIIDTGPGFSKRDIRQLFNSNSLQPSQSYAGTGLGLSIAKQLTRAMNGEFKLFVSRRGGHCLIALHNSRQLALPL